VSDAAEDSTFAPPDESPPTQSPWWATALAVLLFLALGALIVLVLYRVYPAHVTHKASPSFVDLIFESPLVIFASRIFLLSVAVVLAIVGVFTVASIGSWMKHRQWLTKAGPFEVSREAIETLAAQVEFWQQQALAENAEAQELRNRLAETEELLDALYEPESSEEGTHDLDMEGDNDRDDDDGHPQEG
jgi:hypothetical protein